MALRYAVLIGMIAVCVLIGALRPAFFQLGNLANVLRASAATSLMAIGLTFVIGVGAFDLSISGVATLSAVLLVWLIMNGVPLFPGLLICLAVGAAFGTISGFLVSKRRMNPFAVTLALWLSASGPQYILLKGGAGIYLTSKDAPLLRAIGGGGIFGIPWLVIILLLVAGAAHFFYSRTRVGIHMSSIGDNRDAVETSGVNTKKLVWIAYIISGLFAALAGILLVARLNSAQARVADGYLNDAIAAVYLGIALSPKRTPHMIGTVVGSFFISLIANGIYMLNAPYWGEYVFRAVMLFAAVISSGLFRGALFQRRAA
jgi:ribose transport system permease protein